MFTQTYTTHIEGTQRHTKGVFFFFSLIIEAVVRDAGSQFELGLLRESIYNDVIINDAQHSWFT